MKSNSIKIWMICIILLILSVSQVHAIVTIDADNPDIQYVGRISFSDAKAPILYWPGTHIIANFEGTSINVKLHDYGDNYFYIIIDDGAPSLINLTPGANTYAVASGLADSVHKIQIFKRTETQEGEVAFTGFELEDGKSLVAPPERPQRRIEYFGDSITAGHALGYDGETSAPYGKDNYYTYAAITARNFNAEYHCIAVSGIGLYLDPYGFGGNMQTLYYNKRTKSTYWDFDQWTPHIVVINLGQNDSIGPYTQAGAEQNYINFAQTIRSIYPNAHIILALGSMNATAPGSPWPGYLQNAVSELNTTYADSKVYSIIFPNTSYVHPNIAQHAAMARLLTDFIDTSIPDPWLGNVDINSDSVVDNEDFAVLASNWKQTGCDHCNGADLTGDGNVNFDDLLIVANNWLGDYSDHSLMGHWKMNGDASDSSLYANHGTVHGSPVWDNVGHSGGSMIFDGIDDYIEIEGYKGVTGRQSRTVSAWIKTSTGGGIVNWGTAGPGGVNWVLSLNETVGWGGTTGALRVSVGGGRIVGTTDLRDDQWHHVAAVLTNDGSIDVSDIKLYVDSELETSTYIDQQPVNTVGGADMLIGSNFSGLIDDVRVYRRALTDGEVFDLTISKTLIRFGVITDLHYADRDMGGSRYYRDSLSKAAESIAVFNEQKVDFVIELGDFKDQGVPSSEASSISYLQAIEGVFQQFNGPTYHALGNHDMDSISKEQFLANVENTGIAADRSYYSYDVKGVHCVVLDANFNSDGSDYDHGNFDWRDENIPSYELDWLKDDLAAAKGTVIVFLHQNLDGEGEYYFNNSVSVQKILEESGKVAAVFQGHHHAGGYHLINGIHYYTLPAMCEGPFPDNNAYAMVDVLEDRIMVTEYPAD